MMKVLTIETCWQCYYYKNLWCGKASIEIKGKGIPSWCPLEDAVEYKVEIVCSECKRKGHMDVMPPEEEEEEEL
jgi:hypothetical protein